MTYSDDYEGMKTKSKTKKLTLEDFQLTEEELSNLVRGAQTFLPPLLDEDEDEQQRQPTIP